MIPDNKAHGFLTLKPNTIVAYLVHGEYNPSSEHSIPWNTVEKVFSIVSAYVSENEIVISKKDDILGDMLSNIFKDDKYIFYFNELNHSLKVYVNNTYDKGLSGNRNAVKHVKFGGSGVLN